VQAGDAEIGAAEAATWSGAASSDALDAKSAKARTGRAEFAMLPTRTDWFTPNVMSHAPPRFLRTGRSKPCLILRTILIIKACCEPGLVAGLGGQQRKGGSV
jgi:hypothetical protein